jgi:hypothetical protein
MSLTKVHNRLIAGSVANVIDYGADATGSASSTVAVQAAFDANLGSVYFPSGTYKIGAVTINNPVYVTGARNAIIVPSLGLAGGKMFESLTDDVTFEGLNIDGTGETFTPATGNTYLFLSGTSSGPRYKNHNYLRNTVLNASFSDGNPINSGTNLLTTHAFYIQDVDNVMIEGNEVNTLAGACVFARDVSGIRVTNNRWQNNNWYTVNFASDVKHFTISNNEFISATTDGVYWGGAVNIVSDVGQIRVGHGDIVNNYFTGKYSYGAVIRLQSVLNVLVQNNKISGIDNTASGAEITGIAVTTRGISSSNKNSPSENVRIIGNYLEGPTNITNTTGHQRAIVVNNLWWPARQTSNNIEVSGNIINSSSGTLFWDEGITFHGYDGGFKNIIVENNFVKVEMNTSPVIGGAIGFIASSSDGLIDGVLIGGNYLEELATPTGSHQNGIQIGAYTDNVINSKPNTIDNFFYGVRTFTNSGPTLVSLDNQNFQTNTTDTVFGVDLSTYGSFLLASNNAADPAINEQVVLKRTNDTTLTVLMKGADGTVRSVALTLA